MEVQPSPPTAVPVTTHLIVTGPPVPPVTSIEGSTWLLKVTVPEPPPCDHTYDVGVMPELGGIPVPVLFWTVSVMVLPEQTEVIPVIERGHACGTGRSSSARTAEGSIAIVHAAAIAVRQTAIRCRKPAISVLLIKSPCPVSVFIAGGTQNCAPREVHQAAIAAHGASNPPFCLRTASSLPARCAIVKSIGFFDRAILTVADIVQSPTSNCNVVVSQFRLFFDVCRGDCNRSFRTARSHAQSICMPARRVNLDANSKSRPEQSTRLATFRCEIAENQD